MTEWDALFRYGLNLAEQRFCYASIEVFQSLLTHPDVASGQAGKVCDEIGKAYVQLGLARDALHHFTSAIDRAADVEQRVQYEMHLAITYRRLFEYDRAQRMLTQIMDESADSLAPNRRAVLYANLAAVQGLNGFYEDGLENTLTSLKALDQLGISAYHATLYNNLGSFYLHVGDLDNAESCLLSSLELGKGPLLSTLSELSRLRMQQSRWTESMEFAQQALPFVWASIMNYDKDDLATLCLMLAHLCRLTGEQSAAVRLLEKAQLFYGQLSLWREWQQVQTTLDDWGLLPSHVTYQASPEQARQIQQFVVLLDALNAQELIHPRFSALLDMRVLYARALAKELAMPHADVDDLVYACRFSDYGLTTVEPDVVADPTRSSHAFRQYMMHPSLSIEMLLPTGLSEDSVQAISHHHEAYDGTGYPDGLAGEAIPLIARILAVADAYAQGVVNQIKPHSELLEEIRRESGRKFDPVVVDALTHAFATDDSSESCPSTRD